MADIRSGYRERGRYRQAPARYRFSFHSSVVYMPDIAEGPSK